MSSGCGPHGDGLSCGESVEDGAVHLDGASDLEVVHRRCGAGAVGEDRDALALHLPLLDRAQQRVEVDVARGGVGGADALRQPRRGAALRLVPAHATMHAEPSTRRIRPGDGREGMVDGQFCALLEAELGAGALLVHLQCLHERALAQIRRRAVVLRKRQTTETSDRRTSEESERGLGC